MTIYRAGKIAAAFGLVLLLAGCGAPKMQVQRNSLAFIDHIQITSRDASAFTITRIVANGNSTDSACTDSTRVTLQPNEEHDVTFWRCGGIEKLEIETDRGTASFEFVKQAS